MRFALVGLLVAAASPSLAQSRVSIEVGGLVSAYDASPQAGVAHGAITSSRAAVTLPSTGTGGNGATGTGGDGFVGGGASGMPTPAIAAVELRPTVTLDSGFLMGVGFRAGQAGLGDGGASLIGGDLSLGYARRLGPFLPFIKGLFGFNNYEFNGTIPWRKTDLRLDAVIGSRLYVTRRAYIAVAAFAGFGDSYGGSLSVGGDVVQVFRRGRMP